MRAHLVAIATMLVWGTTFVSTKVLLQSFSPVVILVIRFVIGFLALCVMRPHVLRSRGKRDELLFAAAGLTGVALYYLLENISLVYANASLVGVMVSTAPLFTALVAKALGMGRKLGASFFVGFIVAMAGIVLVSIPLGAGIDITQLGSDVPLAFMLCMLAALAWGFYSNIVAKLAESGYETIALTKRCFAWGLLFMLVIAPFAGFEVDLESAFGFVNIANLLFLGLVACAFCFISWNYAVKYLGAARTSAYIYLTPAITVMASALILGEPLTLQIAVGIALTIVGLFMSEHKGNEAD